MKEWKNLFYTLLVLIMCLSFMPIQPLAYATSDTSTVESTEISSPSSSENKEEILASLSTETSGEETKQWTETTEEKLSTEATKILETQETIYTSQEKIPVEGEETASVTPEVENNFLPSGPPLIKSKGFNDTRRIQTFAAPQFTLGGRPGDFLYLVYDRDDTIVSHPKQATVEVFKDDLAGSGTWKTQYYDSNSSGVSLFYSIDNVKRHYVTPYYTVWASSTGLQLKDADAIVSKVDSDTLSVKWVKPEFTFEMRYIYRAGSLSLQREYYLTNTSGKQMTSVKLVYGGDTYFSGNDYGYSYWDPRFNMVYVRSSDTQSNYMGLSGNAASPADAYFGGNYGKGATFGDQATLPNTVTSTNADQSYYLQWNKAAINTGDVYSVSATERYSIGGSVQVLSPESTTIPVPSAPRDILYTFLISNTGTVSAKVNFTAVSSRGYPIDVVPPNYTLPPTSQKEIRVTVTIPANAALGDDKITFTATVEGTGVTSNAFAITTIVAPPDTISPVISTPTYLKGTTWVLGSETVSFNVTDNVAVNQSEVKVKDPSGNFITVTKGAGTSYSFVATGSGIYTIYAKDTSGNSAVVVYTKQINVDNSTPVLSRIQIAPKSTTAYTDITSTSLYTYFTNKNSEIKLTLNDPDSGIRTLYYQFVQDGGTISEAAWTTINFASALQSRDFVLTALPDYTLTPIDGFWGNIAVRIKDDVGNIFTTTLANNGKFVNENQAPITSIAITTPGFNSTQWYSGVSFNALAQDGQSGVAKLEVLLNGSIHQTHTPNSRANGLGASNVTFPGSITIPGVHDLALRTTDKSGNVTTTTNQRIKICSATPLLKVLSSSENHLTKDNITISLSNMNPGVYSPITYYYQKSGELTWTVIGTAEPNIGIDLVVSRNENSTYTFKAVTATNNTSALVTSIVKLDNTIPNGPQVAIQAQTPLTPVNTPDGLSDWFITIPSILVTPASQPTEYNETRIKTMIKFALETDFASANFIEYDEMNTPVITAQGKYKLEIYTEDLATNRSASIVKYIYVDLENPQIGTISVSKINVSDATGNWETYDLFNGNVRVSASVSDTMSGLYNVYYQLVPEGNSFNPNGLLVLATFTSGQYAFTVSPQFKGKVYFATRDISGRTAFLAAKDLILDAIAPTIPELIAKEFQDGTEVGLYNDNTWTSKDVILNGSNSFALSGIESYYYTLNGGTLTALDSAGIQILSNAQSEYKIYARNNLGVLSDPATIRVKSDQVLPTLTAVLASNAPTSGNGVANLNYFVGISGLQSIVVSFEGGMPIDILPRFGGTFDATLQLPQNGTYTFTLTNNAGVSVVQTIVVSHIDREAPANPTYIVSPDIVSVNGSEPYRNEIQTITITPPLPDSGSTIKTYYQLYKNGNSAIDQEYTGPIVVDEDDIYTFVTWSEDAAGNKSILQGQSLYVDLTPPTLNLSFAPEEPGNLYTDKAVVNLTVSDIGSGARLIKYTLKSAVGSPDIVGYRPLFAGAASVRIPAEFKGVLEAEVFDLAGNKSTKTTAEFTVETSKTITYAEAANPSDYQGAWVDSNVIYDLWTSITAPNIEIKGFEVSDDGVVWSTAGISYTAGDITATFTATGNQDKKYFFRAVTEYDDGVVVETRFANSTTGFVTRIDTTDPNIPTVNFTGPETNPGSLIFKNTVSVSLEALDAGGPPSGIKSIQYSLDGGINWILYTGSFLISPQFVGSIQVKAEDEAGNVSAFTSALIKVDRAMPSIPIISATSGSNNYSSGTWVDSSVNLSFSGSINADPAFSGIKEYEYSLNGGNTWIVGNTVTITTNGIVNVRVRSVSETGIYSPVNIFVVKKDDVVADIAVTVSPGGTWTKEDVTFTLSSTQTYLSPYHYEYKKTTDLTWNSLPANIFTLTLSGEYSYDFKLVSETTSAESLGNTAQIDKIVPALAEATLTGTLGDNSWYKTIPSLSSAPITLDQDSVVRSAITTYYSIYEVGEAPPMYNTTLPVLTNDGVWVLDLKTQDAVGNESYTDSKMLKVDSTAPIVNAIAFDPTAVGNLFDVGVKVVLTGSDATSGIRNFEYKIVPDGTLESSVSWQIYNLVYIAPNFKGMIYARATDNAGNQSSVVTASVTVDTEQPPAVTLSGTTLGGNYTQRNWTSQDVTITITDGTPLPISGIDHYQVFDGTNWTDIPLGSTISVTNNGVSIITVRAVSGTRIVGPASIFEVWKDGSSPDITTQAVFADDATTYLGGWTNRDIKILLDNTTNNPSGIRYYHTFNGTTTEITKELTFTTDTAQTGDSHDFQTKNLATPQVSSVISSQTIKIDKIRPEAPQISVTNPDGLRGWYITAGTITVVPTLQDMGSPITTQYSEDGGATWVTYTSAAFSLVNGMNTYMVRSIDEAGNVSEINSILTPVDNVLPTMVDAVYMRKDRSIISPVGGIILVNAPVLVKLKATDGTSGMRSIAYNLLDTSNAVIDSKVVDVAADGTILIELPVGFDGKIEAKATDMAGNSEATYTLTTLKVKVDNTSKPIVSIIPRTSPSNGDWYKDDVTFDLTAEAAEHGLAKVVIQVNNVVTMEVDYTGIVTVPINYVQVVGDSLRNNVIEIIATDHAGNQAQAEKIVNMDKEKPAPPSAEAWLFDSTFVPDIRRTASFSLGYALEGFVNGQKPYSEEWVNQDIHFILGATAGVPSGVESFEFSISADGIVWSTWETISNLPSKRHTITTVTQENLYRFRLKNFVDTYSDPSPVLVAKIDRIIPALPIVSVVGRTDITGIYISKPTVKVTTPAEETGMHSPVTFHASLIDVVSGTVIRQEDNMKTSLIIENLENGSYMLKTYSIDEAGNKSDVQETPITVKLAEEGKTTLTPTPTTRPSNNTKRMAKTGEQEVQPIVWLCVVFSVMAFSIWIKNRKREKIE